MSRNPSVRANISEQHPLNECLSLLELPIDLIQKGLELL